MNNDIELAQLEKEATALRNIANAVLARVERLKKAGYAQPVTKKKIHREQNLHTRVIGGLRKPIQ